MATATNNRRTKRPQPIHILYTAWTKTQSYTKRCIRSGDNQVGRSMVRSDGGSVDRWVGQSVGRSDKHQPLLLLFFMSSARLPVSTALAAFTFAAGGAVLPPRRLTLRPSIKTRLQNIQEVAHAQVGQAMVCFIFHELLRSSLAISS